MRIKIVMNHNQNDGLLKIFRRTDTDLFQLRDFEIEQIVSTFKKKEEVDDFSKVVSFEEIKNKKYSLSAGQYFDIKL